MVVKIFTFSQHRATIQCEITDITVANFTIRFYFYICIACIVFE